MARLKTASPVWSDIEDQKLRIAWGRLSKTNLARAFPGRTYEAVKTRAKRLGVKSDRSLAARRGMVNQANVWTNADTSTLIENRYNHHLWASILPSRKKAACWDRLRKLGIKLREDRSWSEDEDNLIATIIRSRKKLEKTRTKIAIRVRILQREKAEDRLTRIFATVADACASIEDKETRKDVSQDLIVKVLSKEIDANNIGEFVRKSRLKIQGRRMYSLDAPIGDSAGINWIDTIESYREHF